MEQQGNYLTGVPWKAIVLDVGTMQDRAQRESNEPVKTFVSALANREEKRWLADTLLSEFRSMQEYQGILDGMSDTREINNIMLATYGFLIRCIDEEASRMQNHVDPLPVTIIDDR